jgi:putative transposase
MQNGLVESFNGRLRDECLNETLCTSLAHARFVLAAWQHDYNTVRPHAKLGRKAPAEIAGQRVWGHAPRYVAIPSNTHHEGARPYLWLVTIRGAGQPFSDISSLSNAQISSYIRIIIFA